MTPVPRHRARARRQGGFTLIELLMTVILMGIFAAALFSFFFAGTDASRSHESIARAQADARIALARLTRDLRQSVSPDGGTTPPLRSITQDEIEFYSDPSRDPGQLEPVAQRIRYRIRDELLVRQVGLRVGTAPPYAWGVYGPEEVLANNVQNGSLSAFLPETRTGTPLGLPVSTTTNLAATRSVTIRLLMGHKLGNSDTYTEFTTDVTLRNPAD